MGANASSVRLLYTRLCFSRSIIAKEIEASVRFTLRFRMALCYTFRDSTGARLAIYENQRPEVEQEFAGRIDSKN